MEVLEHKSYVFALLLAVSLCMVGCRFLCIHTRKSSCEAALLEADETRYILGGRTKKNKQAVNPSICAPTRAPFILACAQAEAYEAALEFRNLVSDFLNSERRSIGTRPCNPHDHAR